MIVHSNVDLRKVKETVLLGLTKRQCKFMALGIAAGGIFYYLAFRYLRSDLTMFLTIAIAAPFFVIALYESPDGRFLEDVIKDIFKYKRSQKVRTYQTENPYGYLKDKVYQREVLKIESSENVQKTRRIF